MSPQRILIHPGFHKTGTSSIQHFLWVNRAALADHLAVLLLRHLKPAARICMAYSRDQNPLRLTDLVEVMDGILADNGVAPDQLGGRDLLLSCEGLSGHLPGWPNVDSYAAAPVTTAFLTGYFADRFPQADIKVVVTTRDPGSWLSSAWRHHLLGQRLRMDWDAFSTTYGPASHLLDSVRAIAEAVQPATLYTLPLEEAQTHPQGPGGALLEIAALPPTIRQTLRTVGHDNPGPDAETAKALLALNMSDLSDADLRLRKQAMAERAKVGGWIKARAG